MFCRTAVDFDVRVEKERLSTYFTNPQCFQIISIHRYFFAFQLPLTVELYYEGTTSVMNRTKASLNQCHFSKNSLVRR